MLVNIHSNDQNADEELNIIIIVIVIINLCWR